MKRKRSRVETRKTTLESSPKQTFERYISLANAAIVGGDAVAAESYYQHAEHYFRMLHSDDEMLINNTKEDIIVFAESSYVMRN